MIIIRRIVGDSMLPGLPPGKIVVGLRRNRRTRQLKPGKVVIIHHNGIEKIKRIAQVKDGQVYVLGDNLLDSKDSRHFGWLDASSIKALIVWPA